MVKTQKTYNNEEPCSLTLAALALLKADKRDTLEIHKASGLPFYWLVQFKANKFGSSSCNRVQFLYEFLSGKTLDV